jgi:hypothetical protein
VDINSHSLGAHVTFEALKDAPATIVRNAWNFAAAVDNESIEKGERYYTATQRCQRFYVFHSKNDPVLRVWYRIGDFFDFDTALGYSGPEDPRAIMDYSGNLTVINCKDVVASHGMPICRPGLVVHAAGTVGARQRAVRDPRKEPGDASGGFQSEWGRRSNRAPKHAAKRASRRAERDKGQGKRERALTFGIGAASAVPQSETIAGPKDRRPEAHERRQKACELPCGMRSQLSAGRFDGLAEHDHPSVSSKDTAECNVLRSKQPLVEATGCVKGGAGAKEIAAGSQASRAHGDAKQHDHEPGVQRERAVEAHDGTARDHAGAQGLERRLQRRCRHERVGVHEDQSVRARPGRLCSVCARCDGAEPERHAHRTPPPTPPSDLWTHRQRR